MKKVIPFPRRKQPDTATIAAMEKIEKRFGISFWEYMGFTGDKSEVRKKIDRQLHKETLQMTTKIAEEGDQM
jgi:hypothetical protein